MASSQASIFRGNRDRFDWRFPRGLRDGGLELGSDLDALTAVSAIAQFSLKHFDPFVNARHRGDLSCEGIEGRAGLPVRRPACRGFSSRGSR